MSKPHILITNDDGIEAPGLRALYEAIAPHASVSVVAPVRNLSGAGMSVTIDRHMQIDPYEWGNGVVAWSVGGTPTDCVRVALHFLLDETPDLVLSGINWGSNAGRDTHYSGTVGAVLESAMHGVRGVALSVHYEDHEPPNFEVAERYLPDILQFLLNTDYPSHVAFNVNFPSGGVKRVAGFRMARQGLSYWRVVHTPMEEQKVWTGGERALFEEEEESDVHLLLKGYIVAVPIVLPEMTHHEVRLRYADSFESYYPM